MNEYPSPSSPMLNRRRLLALGAGAAAGTLAAFSPRPSAAQLKLDVTQGTIRPIPIALPDFIAGPGVPDPGMSRSEGLYRADHRLQ
jgi:TolB protein